jgi:hypothetical protein
MKGVYTITNSILKKRKNIAKYIENKENILLHCDLEKILPHLKDYKGKVYFKDTPENDMVFLHNKKLVVHSCVFSLSGKCNLILQYCPWIENIDIKYEGVMDLKCALNLRCINLHAQNLGNNLFNSSNIQSLKYVRGRFILNRVMDSKHIFSNLLEIVEVPGGARFCSRTLLECQTQIPHLYRTNIYCTASTYVLGDDTYLPGINEPLFWHTRTNTYKRQAIMTLALCLKRHYQYKDVSKIIISHAIALNNMCWKNRMEEPSIIRDLQYSQVFEKGYTLRIQAKKLLNTLNETQKEYTKCATDLEALEQETRIIVQHKKHKIE